MSRVLSRAEFAAWFDRFMPAVHSKEFKTLTTQVDIAGSNTELEERNTLGGKPHLIGLALTRAKSLDDIAAALPGNDARAQAYRELADFLARRGLDSIFDVDYVGTHWIGSFAIDFLENPGRQSTKLAPSS